MKCQEKASLDQELPDAVDAEGLKYTEVVFLWVIKMF